MIYALAITIAAGLLLIALLSGLGVLVFRGGWRGLALGSWRWRPNTLGFTVMALIAVVLLWRVFPAFMFIPVMLPFFLRGRGRRGRSPWVWRSRRRGPPANGRAPDEGAIEGQFRRPDE